MNTRSLLLLCLLCVAGLGAAADATVGLGQVPTNTTLTTPGPIGSGTPSSGAFTTISATGAITSTLATGTAPLTVASTTKVSNLNADQVDGGDWAAPGAIGTGTPTTAAFTSLSSTGQYVNTVAGLSVAGGILMQSTLPFFCWQETDAAANNQCWDMGPNSALWRLRIMNDDGTSGINAITVGRSTNSVTTVSVLADLAVTTVGKGLLVKEGSNARMGTSVLSSGTVVVSNTSVTSSTRIFLTSNTDGGTPGWLRVSARTASTSFTITSSSGTDSSTVAWILLEPAS